MEGENRKPNFSERFYGALSVGLHWIGTSMRAPSMLHFAMAY